jgi:thiamine biosynthesis lipoprotein
MRITHYPLILIIITLFLTGCNRNQLYEEQLFVFGTIVSISIWGVPTEKARAAVNVIANDLQTMHRHWHAWQASPVTRLNQAFTTGQRWTVEESSLMPLLQLSKRFYQQTDGLFNPAIGKLIELWGFHQEEIPTTPPPSPTEVAQLVALKPTMNDVIIDGKEVFSRNPAVQLDFGAIAKGYAVDLATDKLRQLGIENAIVNAGGNLKAIGQKGDKPWRIGIRHPRGEGVLAAIAVSGEESVITSGDYERFREYNGKRYSHIIDPRTGNSAEGLTSVTVLDKSGAKADAASTALVIAEWQNWYRIARQMELKYVMLVDTAGTVFMTPAMAERVQFQQDKPKIVISEPL